jgi:hypothetical protein
LTTAAKSAEPVAAVTNKATNRPLFGKYVKAGKVVKVMDKVVKVMELYDPVAHLRLNQYIPGHWLEKAING